MRNGDPDGFEAFDEDRPIRLGVSSCLLGNEVRYDGGHKRDRFVIDQLGPLVEWVPVCPEMEVGMGTPRPKLHLVRAGEELRMREIESGHDHTRAMRRFASHRVRALRDLDLSGFVLKKNSPSCGVTRVKVQGDRRSPAQDNRGLFASHLMRTCPNLPVEDEGRLDDAKLRENFVERVFAHRRLRGLFGRRWAKSQLVAFHTAHKLQLMAHAREYCHELGHLVASIDRRPRAEICEAYQSGFMAALARPVFRGKIAKVLQHAAGHLKRRLESASRAELADLIRDYRVGNVPLGAPVTLLRDHARHLEVAYLNGQTFLDPHPKELLLRNQD
ncbi:MAG: DUF523 and DUF1722 domain-containing protein [Deltaproteobacteria bacterium]|nr:DUF523 and DUF1722 domain-containing protein [Deltaproteobacteria bacterium]MBW2578622.1 DUF523 and DUF1722 domain-containing protein [Deltaproteobacteria bacterium]MBW2693771.1 DUF523 and DUF1722 domain-containing protein [Deltaproteobacteria bacterium]